MRYVLLPWPKGSIPERLSILHEPAPLRIRGLKRETATAKRKEMEEKYKKMAERYEKNKVKRKGRKSIKNWEK